MNRHLNKNRFWKATGCAVCLLAILATLGGHWLVLQSFAWARMIHDYSQQESLGSAIAKTFDGKHPCELCLTIQTGPAAGAELRTRTCPAPAATSLSNSCATCGARSSLFHPMAATQAVPTVPRCHTDFIESPPTPPPRAA